MASTAVAAYALMRVFDVVGDPLRVALWLIGAILAHDLVLFPLYALLGLIAGGALVPEARRSRLRVAALNHLRAPALASGLLLLVWFPLIAARAPRTFMRSTGLDVNVYLDRWLARDRRAVHVFRVAARAARPRARPCIGATAAR